MTQLIIVIIIVSTAFRIAGYKLYLSIFSKKKGKNLCSSCSGCDLKKLMISREKECSEHPEKKDAYLKS